jgi:DNA polymerase
LSDDLAPLATDPAAFVFIDVETRSTEDVTIHGAYRHNANGRVTIVAYAIGDAPVKDWVLEDWAPGRKLDWADAPDDLLDALQEVEEGRKWFVSRNAGFEFNAFTRAMTGLEDFRVEWMIDSMIQGMRSHLPADLAGAAKAIGLAQKQAAGKALIKMFAVEGNGVTPQTHPVEWAQFREYARDDVAAMRDVFFATMPLSRREWSEYHAVEAINHRGVPVDVPFVRQAVRLSERLTETSNADIARLTGGKVRTVNQSAALLEWLRWTLRALPEVDRILTREIDLVEDEDGEQHAVAKHSLGRSHVEELIAYLERVDREQGLTDDEFAALQVLEVRLYGASATPKKYKKIEALVEGDGRLRGQYVFNGAAATGRMSGRGAQPQNLARATIGTLDDEAAAIEMIADRGVECFEDLREKWGPVGRTLSRLIRPAFVAPEGKTFVWCDWSAIEARVLPWLAGSEGAQELLDVFFANDRDKTLPDIYKITAAKILGKSAYDITKQERQSHGKVPCIAEGQLVLTDKGEVPIEKIGVDMLLWDGVGFVPHEGLVCKGIKDVWEYQGVVATADHIVWTEEAGQQKFLIAARSGFNLVRSGSGGTPIRAAAGGEFGAALSETEVQDGLRGDPLRGLRCGSVDELGHAGSSRGARMQNVSAARGSAFVADKPFTQSAVALHGPQQSRLAPLRRSRDTVSVQGCLLGGALGGAEPRAGTEEKAGSDRQRRTLRAGELALGDTAGAVLEHRESGVERLGLRSVGVALCGTDGAGETLAGVFARGDTGPSPSDSRAPKREELARHRGKARVYDLVNAGPRNRFTVSGKLVHNCLALGFGGGKGALFNMARAYGAAFTDDEAQKIVDDWRASSPWATRFWDQMWTAVLWCMENPGEPREVGRVTLVFDAEYLRGTLFIVLPCGRPLLYPGLRWQEVERKDKKTGEVSVRVALTVRRARARLPLTYLDLCNNITQGTAASLLRRALVLVEQEPFLETVLATHDEIVCMADQSTVEAAKARLAEIMLDVPDWADGLPVAAEATVGSWYSKASEG